MLATSHQKGIVTGAQTGEEVTDAARQLSGASGHLYEADQIIERAAWAARVFSQYSREEALTVAETVAEAGAQQARRFAQQAVEETGFGVVEHKMLKNELCSRGLFRHYKSGFFAGYRVNAQCKTVEIARPAGVIFALTPSTNPIATLFFKVISSLITRNAIIVSPHPMARNCSSEAAAVLEETARVAGAPDGAIQCIDNPDLKIIERMMRSPKINVILATGGMPMVRAAYSSGNPAIGVGPGNCPALVDETADITRAAHRIILSKAFDNSVLCTNESIVVALAPIANRLRSALASAGGRWCSPSERTSLENYLFPKGRFNTAAVGKSADWIAKQAGFRAGGAKVLLVELDRVSDDYPMSREKLCPVLGFCEVRGFETALALCRDAAKSGPGHSAAIHSENPRAILAFGNAVPVLRMAVNESCSLGASGYQTHLAPSMTIGTGFFGRSAIGENIGPQHLINWTRLAYSSDPKSKMPDFDGIDLPCRKFPAAVSNFSIPKEKEQGPSANLREQVRRIVTEELRALSNGGRQ